MHMRDSLLNFLMMLALVLLMVISYSTDIRERRSSSDDREGSSSFLSGLGFADDNAEDAYIENSNGNQYFNTGHFIGPHTRIEIDLQLLEVLLWLDFDFWTELRNYRAMEDDDLQE